MALQSLQQCGATHTAPGYSVAPAPQVAPVPQVAPAVQILGPQITYPPRPMSPTATRYSGLQAPQSPVTQPAPSLFGSAVQYTPVHVAQALTSSPQPSDEADDDDDEDSDDGALLPAHLRNPVDAPKPPPGAQHPSIGSEAHSAGTCKRCCFFPRGRCTNGYTCEFCHYEHEKRKRKNKKKKRKDCYAPQVAAGHHRGSFQQMAFHGLRQMATVIEESPRQLLAAATPREQVACQAVGAAVLDDGHHQQVLVPSYGPGQMMPGVLGRIIYGPTQGFAPSCPQQLSPQQLQPQMQPPQLPPQQLQTPQLQQQLPPQARALEMAPPPIQSPRLPQVVIAAPPMTSAMPLVPPPMNSPKLSRTMHAMSPGDQQQACATQQWGGAIMFQMVPQTTQE